MKLLSQLKRTIKTGLGGWISVADLALLRTAKSELLPPNFEVKESWLPSSILGSAGIDLREQYQTALMETFSGEEFKALYEYLRNDCEINCGLWGRDYRPLNLIHNGFYPTPDAEIYASMIALFKPVHIVEIGSGYSTVIARKTLEFIGHNARISVIDPEPRRAIQEYADEIILRRVEDSHFNADILGENTLLFIDSSHVCRRGGDLPNLYCTVLPLLGPNVLCHVHDIFIPYDYPDNYVSRFYTEQYILHALLAHTQKYEVIFSTHCNSRRQQTMMSAVFGPSVGVDPLFYGASFWFRTKY